MRNLVRLLIMFGPMLMRQFQKYQRNKQRKEGYATPDRLPKQRQQEQRKEYIPVEEIPREPVLSEDEKNFKLDEDDIMLDQEDLVYVRKDQEPEADYEDDFKS